MTGTKMRPFRKTIPFDDALALAVQAAVPLDRTERIALEESAGRVLAAAGRGGP